MYGCMRRSQEWVVMLGGIGACLCWWAPPQLCCCLAHSAPDPAHAPATPLQCTTRSCTCTTTLTSHAHFSLPVLLLQAMQWCRKFADSHPERSRRRADGAPEDYAQEEAILDAGFCAWAEFCSQQGSDITRVLDRCG